MKKLHPIFYPPPLTDTLKKNKMAPNELEITDAAHIRQSFRWIKKQEPPTRKITRTLSVAFREGEALTLEKVLNEVDTISEERYSAGFNEFNFTVGVLNIIIITLIFGKYPQHFWLLYLVESCFLLPRKIMVSMKAKPYNEALYLLDFCWMMNFSGMTILLVFGMEYNNVMHHIISPELRKNVFLASMGISCGPLLGATALLPFVAMVFHDINSMTGLFIHILPPLLGYTFRWHGDEIQNAWPGIFRSLGYSRDNLTFFPSKGFSLDPSTWLDCVAGNATLLYLIWFIPFTLWMLFIGLDLPRSNRRTKNTDGTPRIAKYDTVFHSLMRGGACYLYGSVVWGRTVNTSKGQIQTNDFELRDFILYMSVHFILCTVIYAL